MIHLKSIQLREIHERLKRKFPFSVPIIQSMDELKFTSPITFLVGENGSGKSTFLEALAAAVGSITAGSQSVRNDPTLQASRDLGDHFRLTWQKRTKKGFFLRAEDFFGYAKRLAQMRQELENDIRKVEDDYNDRSDYAAGLAKMPYSRELSAMEGQYTAGGWIMSRMEKVSSHCSNPGSCPEVSTFWMSLKSRFLHYGSSP